MKNTIEKEIENLKNQIQEDQLLIEVQEALGKTRSHPEVLYLVHRVLDAKILLLQIAGHLPN